MVKKQPILEVRNLSKIYKNGRGVKDVSFEIFPGEIVGFIGPNGAGKSTTMRVLMGLSHRTAGAFSLFGKEILEEKDLKSVIHKIGYQPAEGGLYENLSPRKQFNYSNSLYAHPSKTIIKKYSEALKLDINIPIKTLSTGNKKKVEILLALLHNPSLVILDEPTSGLDPLIQQELLKILKRKRKKGGAIFLSSHVLSEVQSICDRIIMIKEGEIIFTGKTKDILEKEVNIIRINDATQDLVTKLKKLKAVRNIKEYGEETLVYTHDNKPVIDLLVNSNIYDFYIEKPSLEERFLDFY